MIDPSFRLRSDSRQRAYYIKTRSISTFSYIPFPLIPKTSLSGPSKINKVTVLVGSQVSVCVWMCKLTTNKDKFNYNRRKQNWYFSEYSTLLFSSSMFKEIRIRISCSTERNASSWIDLSQLVCLLFQPAAAVAKIKSS